MANDILLEQNGDMMIKNGDFVVDYSDDQHIDLILRSNPGEIKDYPLLGLGIANYLNSPISQRIKQVVKRDLRIQLQSDNAKNIKIDFSNQLKVKANYEG